MGDLNPLYELPLQEGTQIAVTWEMLLKRNPRQIYYGHAKMTTLGQELNDTNVSLQ